MKSEFEEKTFEQYLNCELMGKKQLFFPPGQVLEGSVGTDAFIFSISWKFWRLWDVFRFPFWPPWPGGIIADEIFWTEFGRAINEYNFPKFKFNLFIQHKRPEYITSKRAKEWADWRSPYFKYNIQQKQQEILKKLERHIENKGIVVYACPAFYEYKKLFEYKRRRAIIENTNFAQPINLQGHNRYTFVNPGRYGMAHSETRKIENFDLMERIEVLFKKDRLDKSNTQFIKNLAIEINQIIMKTNRYYKKIWEGIFKDLKLPNSEFAKSFVSIILFCLITNLIWGIGCVYSNGTE